jgi:hypothetical protein
LKITELGASVASASYSRHSRSVWDRNFFNERITATFCNPRRAHGAGSAERLREMLGVCRLGQGFRRHIKPH